MAKTKGLGTTFLSLSAVGRRGTKLQGVEDFCLNLDLTVVQVPYSLDSGRCGATLQEANARRVVVVLGRARFRVQGYLAHEKTSSPQDLRTGVPRL